MFPLMIGSGGAEVKHGMGIGFFPPGTGDLESFLDDVPMAALNLPRADGQVLRLGAGIIQTVAPLHEITVSGADRSLLKFGGFDMRL